MCSPDILNQDGSAFQRRLVDSGLWHSILVNYYTLNHTGPITISGETTRGQAAPCARGARRGDREVRRSGLFTAAELAPQKQQRAVSTVLGLERASGFAHELGFWWSVAGLEYYMGYVDNMAKQYARRSSRVRAHVHRRQAARHGCAALAGGSQGAQADEGRADPGRARERRRCAVSARLRDARVCILALGARIAFGSDARAGAGAQARRSATATADTSTQFRRRRRARDPAPQHREQCRRRESLPARRHAAGHGADRGHRAVPALGVGAGHASTTRAMRSRRRWRRSAARSSSSRAMTGRCSASAARATPSTARGRFSPTA